MLASSQGEWSGMSKDTFNRKEVKYRLRGPQREAMMRAVASHLPESAFGRTRVSSVYLDTPERSVIARSLEKPLYKEKLRVRWYGSARLAEADAAFIELKKKFKGIVYKRRLETSPGAAQAFLKGASCVELEETALSPADADPCSHRFQIAREMDASRLRMGDVRPSALITCDRLSFGTDEAADALRITFDDHLRAVGLFASEGSVPLLTDADAVMEVKCLGAYPFWLVDALNEVQAHPRSFSKYGSFFESVKRPAKTKEGTCA